MKMQCKPQLDIALNLSVKKISNELKYEQRDEETGQVINC